VAQASTKSEARLARTLIDGPIFLSAEETERAFDWRAAIDCLELVYAGELSEGMTPPRVVARGQGVWFRALAAVSPSRRFMGAKLFGLGRGRSVSYLIALFDQESGALRALMDAKFLTAVRTAATSAVAAKRLVRPGPLQIVVLGSGTEAQAHARAIATVLPVGAFAVSSPTAANRTALAAALTAEFGVPARALAQAEEAVREADLVIAAARSRDESPILHGAWLRPGATVISIGSTLPEQREIDPACVARAALIVADMPEEVVEQTGDMIAARKAGVAFEGKLISLAALLRGQPRLHKESEIVLYKSVGAAIQDVAVAELLYDRALLSGGFSRLPFELSIKQV
jgi:ornithine cyclodeaminase/alanine dehydrogenase